MQVSANCSWSRLGRPAWLIASTSLRKVCSQTSIDQSFSPLSLYIKRMSVCLWPPNDHFKSASSPEKVNTLRKWCHSQMSSIGEPAINKQTLHTLFLCPYRLLQHHHHHLVTHETSVCVCKNSNKNTYDIWQVDRCRQTESNQVVLTLSEREKIEQTTLMSLVIKRSQFVSETLKNPWNKKKRLFEKGR